MCGTRGQDVQDARRQRETCQKGWLGDEGSQAPPNGKTGASRNRATTSRQKKRHRQANGEAVNLAIMTAHKQQR